MRDFSLTIVNGQPVMGYAESNTLKNNVYLSLYVRLGSLFCALWFGSRLHLVRKLDPASVGKARDYCAEALAWMVEYGRAKKIDVIAERDSDNVKQLNILVSITTLADVVVPMTIPYHVI